MTMEQTLAADFDRLIAAVRRYLDVDGVTTLGSLAASSGLPSKTIAPMLDVLAQRRAVSVIHRGDDTLIRREKGW